MARVGSNNRAKRHEYQYLGPKGFPLPRRTRPSSWPVWMILFVALIAAIGFPLQVVLALTMTYGQSVFVGYGIAFVASFVTSPFVTMAITHRYDKVRTAGYRIKTHMAEVEFQNNRQHPTTTTYGRPERVTATHITRTYRPDPNVRKSCVRCHD